MDDAALYQKALIRAAELAGGVEALAERLGISPFKVRRMLSGESPVPPAVFLDVVDLLAMHDLSDLNEAKVRRDGGPSPGSGSQA